MWDGVTEGGGGEGGENGQGDLSDYTGYNYCFNNYMPCQMLGTSTKEMDIRSLFSYN